MALTPDGTELFFGYGQNDGSTEAGVVTVFNTSTWQTHTINVNSPVTYLTVTDW